MSYQTFFLFAAGLSAPLVCPSGTMDQLMRHVRHIESVMGIKRTRYKDNPEHWNTYSPAAPDLDDEAFCREASAHNEWVIWTYEDFAKWAAQPPAGEVETITPEQAQAFWPALHFIRVPVERWDRHYYRERMEHLYEVMRGRESEGVSFDAKALTKEQAGAVILLFSEFLDSNDLRLAVPNGHDCLKSSYDGGYTWCEKCGAVDEYDVDGQLESCRRRKCPLKKEFA